MRPDLKVAIIGGAGKMGRWFARLLLKEDFAVIISDINNQALSSAQEELKVEAALNPQVMKSVKLSDDETVIEPEKIK